MEKKLRKSRTDTKICGVCGGIAEYIHLDSTIVRLLFLLFAFFGAGTGLLVYIIAAIVMPSD